MILSNQKTVFAWWLTLACTSITSTSAFSSFGRGIASSPSFLLSPPSCAITTTITATTTTTTSTQLHMSTPPEREGQRKNSGKNWIEKSSPTGMSLPSANAGDIDSSSGGATPSEAADYTLGIDGESFSLGPLSLQVFDALISVASKRFPDGEIPTELENIYKSYAMTLAGKEATQLALKQNGLEFDVMSQSMKEDSEEENWGEMENIKIGADIYETPEEAVEDGQWSPGQPFSFVVRNVRAKEKEMDIKELLAAIDPDGTLRTELDTRPEYSYDPAEIIKSLKDVASDNERRCNEAPREVDPKGRGIEKTLGSGYDVIPVQDIILNDDDAIGKIMEALEAHTYLIVDLGNPDTTTSSDDDAAAAEPHPAKTLHSMWQAIEQFFDNPDRSTVAPKMEVAPDAGSHHAVVGYATYEEEAMQFLETRIVRSSMSQDKNEIQPPQIKDLIGETSVQNVIDAFRVISKVGKDIVTIAIAAATQEANAYTPDYDDDSAFEYAKRMVDDLMDDGTSLPSTEDKDTTVSMSPHRMCRYSAIDAESAKASEIFGAHTDTSFVTIVPCAAVSGLEVFDEETNNWIRPELIARQHWEAEQAELQKQNLPTHDESKDTPWHSRFIVVMSGEFLQLATRSMIPSAVHRVVAVNGGDARLSAPVLLRARSKMVMDIEKYFGESPDQDSANADLEVIGKELLLDCNQMTMEQIHDSLQP